MKISRLVGATLPVLALCVFSTSASATALIGTVTADYLFPDEATIIATSALTVGTTLNCTAGGPGICAPFTQPATFLASGLSITLTEQAGSSYSAATFNGISFSDLTFDDGSTLVGFSLDTDLPGLTVANISLTPTSIQFNGQGLSFLTADYFITLNLITRAADPAVPEPATWAMMIGGFALAGAAMRRRKATVRFA